LKVTKCVNNRCDVNYIGKFSNSYILGSVMNYKLPGSKSQASVTKSNVLLYSEKLAGKTLPGCNNLKTFKQF